MTGKRSTTFCIVCSYDFSIRTQLLLLRAYSKSCSIYTMKPTQIWMSSKSDSGPAKENTRLYCPEDALATTVGGRAMCEAAIEMDQVILPLRRTMLLLCKRLSRSLPRPRMPDYIVRLNPLYTCIYMLHSRQIQI